MGAYGVNNAVVRGSACDFPAAGNTLTGYATEGWVLVAGDGIVSLTGSGDTVSYKICGQATGNSGGVGGPTAYF